MWHKQKKLAAMIAAVAMLFSGAGSVTAYAEVTSVQETFIITEELLDENGVLVLENIKATTIIISKDLKAKKVIMKNVVAEAVIVEDGALCDMEISGGSIGTLEIEEQKVEKLTLRKLADMIASGMTKEEAIKEFKAVREELRIQYRKKLMNQQEQPPCIRFDSSAKVTGMKVSGGELKLTVDGFYGALEVVQTQQSNGDYGVMKLELNHSELTKAEISGNGQNSLVLTGVDSDIENVVVEGSANVVLDVATKKLETAENSESVSLIVLDSVEEAVVQGTDAKVVVASEAVITKAEITGENVVVTGAGTLTSAAVSSESATVETENTEVYDPAKVTPVPTATPRPTATPSYNGGSSAPAWRPTATPRPTTTPKPTATPVPTTAPETEDPSEDGIAYTDEVWFNYMDLEDGTVEILSLVSELYDEETEEVLETFTGTVLNIPETINGMQVSGLSVDAINIDSVTEVRIPSGVSYISEYAFEMAEGLKTITVDEDNAFFSAKNGVLYDKDMMTLVCVPAKNSTTNFVVPDSVEYISRNAFWNPVSTITLSENVQDFSIDCVNNNSALTDITVSENNGYFKDYGSYILAASGSALVYVDKGTTEFTVPGTVTELDAEVFSFSNCLPMTSIAVEEGNTAYCVEDGLLLSANKTELLLCTLEAEGISTEDGVRYEIPDYVTQIGAFAFKDYSKFDYIDIAGEVTSIGKGAFYGSTIKEFSIPETVTDLGIGTFRDCKKLERIVISENITELPRYFCANCRALSEISLPESMEIIGTYAFMNCTSLSNIEFPINQNLCIDNFAFWRCTGLQEIVIPENVYLRGSVFYNCTGLETITMYKYGNGYISEDYSYRNIYNNSCWNFKGCTKLTELYIYDESVTTFNISELNYIGTKVLTQVYLPGSITSIKGGNSKNKNLTIITSSQAVIDYAAKGRYEVVELSE